MNTVIIITVLILRLLVIYQMGELVRNVKTPLYQKTAIVGLFVYVGYFVYSLATQVPIVAEGIFSLVAVILALTGANKCIKKVRGSL